MAVELAITTPSGIDLPAAYIRVVGFSGDKTYVSYIVRTWANAAARGANKTSIAEVNFSFNYVNGLGDVMVACYNDLMARSEFAGAISV